MRIYFDTEQPVKMLGQNNDNPLEGMGKILGGILRNLPNQTIVIAEEDAIVDTRENIEIEMIQNQHGSHIYIKLVRV